MRVLFTILTWCVDPGVLTLCVPEWEKISHLVHSYYIHFYILNLYLVPRLEAVKTRLARHPHGAWEPIPGDSGRVAVFLHQEPDKLIL
ncbi:hypothetical protein JW935_12100 [candidate division KSB1 bacterium]|nr:hypothetical protein [candidate division KSB1 bacterium]